MKLLLLTAGCSTVPPGVPKIKVPVPDDLHQLDTIIFTCDKPEGVYC